MKRMLLWVAAGLCGAFCFVALLTYSALSGMVDFGNTGWVKGLGAGAVTVLLILFFVGGILEPFMYPRTPRKPDK
jgi:hypothetical protein